MSAAEAVPPQGSPVPTMSDLAYANMYAWQEALVRPFATTTGLAPGTVLFTLALFASLPLGAGFHSSRGDGSRTSTASAPVRAPPLSGPVNRRTHRDPGIDITPSRLVATRVPRAPPPRRTVEPYHADRRGEEKKGEKTLLSRFAIVRRNSNASERTPPLAH